MPTEHKGDLKPRPKAARDRSVSDVAREAFENRLIEGDRPANRVSRRAGRSPGNSAASA